MQDGWRTETGHHELESLIIRNDTAVRCKEHSLRRLILTDEEPLLGLYRVLAVAEVSDTEFLPS